MFKQGNDPLDHFVSSKFLNLAKGNQMANFSSSQKNVGIIGFLTCYTLNRVAELKLHSPHFFEFIQLSFRKTQNGNFSCP